MRPSEPWPSARTAVAGLIGDSVAGSLSPVIHNAGFAASGLDWAYVAFEVPRGEAATAIRGARALGLAGLSVTIPHKSDVIPELDELTTTASNVGAVNTVTRRGEALVGDNTDVGGFLVDVERAAGREISGATVVLLGAGGAARAAAYAAAERGASRIVIVARDASRAADLGGTVGIWAGGAETAVETVTFDDSQLRGHLGVADLVVNATPVGSTSDDAPIDIGAVSRDAFIYDLIYRDTPLVRSARASGIAASNGLGMLVEQAALQFEIWTGQSPPRRAMSDAAALAMEASGTPE